MIEAAMVPATEEAIAVLLAPLGELFGWPENWPEIAPIYFEALGHLPPEALAEAVSGCLGISGCRFFPKPIEIGERLSPDWGRLCFIQSRLKAALAFAERSHPR